MKMSTIKGIRASWIDETGGYAYEMVPERFVTNDAAQTVLVELHEIAGQHRNFEVVIQRDNDGRYHFKTGYYGEPTEEFSLKNFLSEDEFVLVYEGRHGVAYFHLMF